MTPVPADDSGVRVKVPAKVNLELRVGSRRADGYHGLATVYQGVSLYDIVEARPARDWSITIGGRTAAGVPADESNLAMRAAHDLAAACGVGQPVALSITKEIPVAGGMAGGSADAAATLVACNRLWGLDLTLEELEPVAAGLGSDVPFLLHGGTCLGAGRGEQVVPLLSRGTYHWVFALADTGLSAAAVYAESDRLRGDAQAVAAQLTNDLEAAAISLQPRLAEVLEAGLAFGALGGVVSGSGPTVAFLARDRESAIDLAVALTASGVAPDVRRARGPVTGAQIDVLAPTP